MRIRLTCYFKYNCSIKLLANHINASRLLLLPVNEKRSWLALCGPNSSSLPDSLSLSMSFPPCISLSLCFTVLVSFSLSVLIIMTIINNNNKCYAMMPLGDWTVEPLLINSLLKNPTTVAFCRTIACYTLMALYEPSLATCAFIHGSL